MKISKGLKQAYDLQDFTFDAAIALRDSLSESGKLKLTRDDATAIGQVVRAWESCQTRVAFHRRVPSPGSIKHQPKKPARPKRSVPAFTEPT